MQASVEYMCKYCGKKTRMLEHRGKPAPGKCPRRNGDLPHQWVVNRKF